MADEKVIEGKPIENVPLPIQNTDAPKEKKNNTLKIILGIFAGCALLIILTVGILFAVGLFTFRKVKDVTEDFQEEYEDEVKEFIENLEEEIDNPLEGTPEDLE